MTVKRKFYRDKFNGKLLGVCAGFGDYFEVDPIWFRLGFIVAVFFGFGLIIPIYFVIVVITQKRPPSLYTESLDHVFGPRNSSSPSVPAQPATRKEVEE